MVEIEIVGNVRIIRLQGELDFSNSDVLARALEERLERETYAIVSFEDCRYIDSSVLNILVRYVKEYGRGALRCAVPPGNTTRRVFEITHLDQVMNVCNSLAQALGDDGDDGENRETA